MEKILIVEDNKLVSENLYQLLSIEGYQCKLANNGKVALKILKNSTPDLILSDITMPQLDGFELYKNIKKNKSTSRIPFIFLSAKNDKESIRKGMAIGVDDYITKPYSINDLLISIKIRLEKRKNIKEELNEYRLNITKYVPHELRTPLVSILGYSDIILNDKEITDITHLQEMVFLIKKSGMRLLKRVEKFILYTEVATLVYNSQIKSECKRTNINSKQIEKIIFDDEGLQIRNQDIHFFLEEEFLALEERYLKFIVKELIQNSIKFSNNGDLIEIHGTKQSGFTN